MYLKVVLFEKRGAESTKNGADVPQSGASLVQT